MNILTKKNKQNKGFTLIELLVVVAIIGILASVVLASLNSARVKARDVKRMSDIRQIENALQLYITDKGHAPDLEMNCSNPLVANSNCHAVSSDTSWAILEAELAPYISSLPTDPCVTDCAAYFYEYQAPSYLYYLGEPLEDPLLSTSYQIYAETLEGDGGSFGVGVYSY